MTFAHVYNSTHNFVILRLRRQQ